MVKDLRTKPFALRVGKCNQLSADEEAKWNLYQTQTFIPCLETLFKTDVLQSAAVYGIKLSDSIQAVISPGTVQLTSGKQAEIHRKTTCILSPFRSMRGDYGSLGLPAPSDTSGHVVEKLQSPHTAAYVGALASVVLSESDCPHFPKVYGVYCGMAKIHSIDISDDYEELSDRPWFAQNIGKTFNLKLRPVVGTPAFQHTRSQRPAIVLDEMIALDGIQDIEVEHQSDVSPASMVGEDEPMGDEEGDDGSTSTEDVFAIESCDCESDGSDFGDDEESEPYAWAELQNVPVVTTVMEKCEGTFYDLIKLDTDPVHHLAFVAQVIFALSYAQRIFALTHNDLHGNNIMFVRTAQEFMSYNLDGILYRVPTYGYLMKIIDFDRAIFSVRLNGMRDPKLFMSDQFKEEEEAGGQYNMEPFFTQSQPSYRANASFDLVRLATSMYWDLFPGDPAEPSESPLKALFIRWMTLGDGTSVLFGKKNPEHDRYHGFDQYKAIARFCKDTAVPRKEVAFLSTFKTEKVPLGDLCVLIES